MEDLVKLLINSNLKLVEKETGIPYDRMYKWIKGKATPKTLDYNTLLNYFNNNSSIDGNSSNSVDNTHSNENITKENLPISNKENTTIGSINSNVSSGINQDEKTDNYEVRSSGERGSFYKALPKPVIEAKPISLHPHNDDDDSGNAKYVFAPDGTMGMRVPIVPVKAQAGYLLGFADPEFYEDFETEIIPVYQEHRGTYLGFEVKGDSMITTDPEQMENNIYPGWRAIGKDLPKSKWAYKLHTHKYDYWIIVHRTEGILIKAITKHDVASGIITIHSLNPSYEDKDLHLSDIEQIFNVVQIVPKKRR